MKRNTINYFLSKSEWKADFSGHFTAETVMRLFDSCIIPIRPAMDASIPRKEVEAVLKNRFPEAHLVFLDKGSLS